MAERTLAPLAVSEDMRAQLAHELGSAFPTLRIDERGDSLVVTGTFPVRDRGRILDEYRIALALPADYPDSLPIVTELDGKIPRDANYHRNPDGSLCVVLPDAFWFENKRCELVSFLQGPVHSYFFGVTHFVATGEWPFGEHAHGPGGVLAYYESLLGVRGAGAVGGLLTVVAQRARPRGHLECQCGSGRILNQCHGPILSLLRQKLGRNALRHSLRLMVRLA